MKNFLSLSEEQKERVLLTFAAIAESYAIIVLIVQAPIAEVPPMFTIPASLFILLHIGFGFRSFLKGERRRSGFGFWLMLQSSGMSIIMAWLGTGEYWFAWTGLACGIFGTITFIYWLLLPRIDLAPTNQTK